MLCPRARTRKVLAHARRIAPLADVRWWHRDHGPSVRRRPGLHPRWDGNLGRRLRCWVSELVAVPLESMKSLCSNVISVPFAAFVYLSRTSF